ncbi:unnamed protein product, partial [Musa acuminata subsp. burmannicoides]
TQRNEDSKGKRLASSRFKRFASLFPPRCFPIHPSLFDRNPLSSSLDRSSADVLGSKKERAKPGTIATADPLVLPRKGAGGCRFLPPPCGSPSPMGRSGHLDEFLDSSVPI